MVNLDYYKIGQKIRNFRRRENLSQSEMENKAEMSPGSLSRIENGEVNPTKETLLKIIDVLNLTTIEASALFGLELTDISNILKLSKDLLSTQDLNEVMQKAVNSIVYELNLLSAFMTLRKDNKLFATTTTNKWFDGAVLKIIGAPLNTLSVDLNKDLDNLCVKAFLNKKHYISNNLEEITVPAVPPRIAQLLTKVTGFKSAIVLPIMYKDKSLGTLMVGKNFIDDYLSEIPILEAFTEYIGEAIHRSKS